MKRHAAALSIVLFGAPFVACSSGSLTVGSDQSGQQGGACTTDADCGQGICGFDDAAACGATGKCFAAPGVQCNAFSPGCACDGSEINTICNGLPSGFTRKPLAHAGACGDAAAGVCVKDSDCGPNALCGYNDANACNATGQCFAISGATCQAYLPGCACDGSSVNTICNGLPSGYTSKPLAHSGACTDAGIGGPCTTNADCGSGPTALCGFKESDACSATGVCFSNVGPLCNSVLIACACDGTEMNVACNGLPDGYSPKPYLHASSCADAGK